MKKLRYVIIECYLDFVNNYTLIDRFAEHNGLLPDEAETLINLCREVVKHGHPEE